MTKDKSPEKSMVIFVSQEKDNLQPFIKNRPPALFFVAGKRIVEWAHNIGKKHGIDKIILLASSEDRDTLYDYLEDYMEISAPYNEIGPFTIIDYDPKEGVSSEISKTLISGHLLEKSIWLDGNVVFSEEFFVDFIEKASGTGKYALIGYDVDSEFAKSFGIGFFDKQYLEQSLEKAKCVNDIYTKIRKTVRSDTQGLEYIGTEMDFWQINYLWDLLDANQNLINDIDDKNEGIIEEGATTIGKISIGKGTRIRAGSYLEGPLSIGNDCDIGPNCYLRKGVSLANHVRIGNGCELKNSIIEDGTHIAHLSYVGDSVVGANCNFGAGTITGNLRLDDQKVKAQVGNKVHSTGRRKVGVIMGDKVKTAIDVFFMPGVMVGNKAAIGTGVIVSRNIASGKFVYVEQQQKVVDWKPKPKPKKKS